MRATDLTRLVELDASSMNLTDGTTLATEGLQYATNLQFLNLSTIRSGT